MKKVITLILTFALVITLSAVFTGCTKNEEPIEKNAVCYVVANTANSQGLNLQSPLVQDTINSTILNYGYISVVNADGVPEVVLAQSFDIDAKYKNASKDKLAMDARSKATNFINGMNTVIADDPEVDYLEALRLAVRSLSSLEGYDSKMIVVLGTGLSTTGVLNFNNNLISAEPNVIIDLLKEKSEIPDFTGITVYWQQLGDVAAPQKSLTSAQKNKLQQIYGSLVEAGNGTFKYNDIMSNPVNTTVEYPAVTPVDLPEDTPIVFDADALNTDDKAFQEPQILNESKVEFVADKASYLYPDKAVENIRPIAEYLLEHDTVKLLLVGSTAGDTTNETSLKLSQDRADAVKQTLVDLGVSAERITTKGMGSSDPWHVPNVGYEGAAASGNRKVVLLDVRTETAQSIIGGTDV